MESPNSLVKIRPFSKNDEKSYYDISCSKSVKEYFPYYSENFQEVCDIARIFTKGDFLNTFYFAIEEKEEGNLVGQY